MNRQKQPFFQHKPRIEYRTIRSQCMVPDLADQVMSRLSFGPILIVADRPIVLISTLRKRWRKIQRKLLVARASTLDAQKISQLTNALTILGKAQFSANNQKADVYVIQPEEISFLSKDFATIYLCSSKRQILPNLVPSVKKDGFILVYATLD